MLKYVWLMVLIPNLSWAWSNELAASITQTRMEYVGELVKEFREICGVFPHDLESLFDPELDSCPQFPRLMTAYTLLDGWDHPLEITVRGQGAYISSYGADHKLGGRGADQDVHSVIR